MASAPSPTSSSSAPARLRNTSNKRRVSLHAPRLLARKERQGERERAAGSLSAGARDRAAHQDRELARDVEPESGAAEAARGRGVGLREGLEQARALLLGH